MEKKPLLCLIDASGFIFRAFYAVRHLSNKSGLPTNAVFGFANMILKVLEDVRPTHIAVIYDTKHPSFRKEMYAEYKANRSAVPEELVPQFPYIKKFVKTLGLPAFEQEGFEADDLIATFAHQAADLSQEHPDVCIVSSDKDLMQLVTDKIYLYDTMKDQRYYPQEVKEKLGVLPELVPDYLGIVGDTSDNIPGVKGIGPKGAVALLEQFGSMEGIYENIEAIKKEGQRKTLIDCKDQAILSKRLATVKRDMKIPTDWHSLRCEPKAGEDFFALLQELDFQNLEKKMRAWAMPEGSRSSRHEPGKANNAVIAPAPPFDPEMDSASGDSAISPSAFTSDEVAAAKKAYVVVKDLTELERIFKSLAAVKEIAIDTETTSLEVHDASVVGFSFCADGATAYYVPVGHLVAGTDYRCEGQCDAEDALALFAKFLDGKKIVGQNLKYDLNVLRAAGIQLKPEQIAFDTMIASYILTPDGRHNLDLLSEKYLGHRNIKFEDVVGEGKTQIPFAQSAIETAGDYAAEDAHVAYLLTQKLRAQLAALPAQEKVFREIDMPLLCVLAAMEWEGVAIDVPLLKELSEKFAVTLKELEKEAHKLAGGEFNLASPKQLQKILFEDLKLPAMRKTKTGFSTDVDVLQKLSSLHALPALILEVRELSKLKGTYVDVLPTLVHPKTGRVHAHFNQTVAATGRLSSSDPNLQNIPIRTESGKLVRKAFVARPGWSLIGADYSQIELRILASMSGDESLTKAFTDGQDVHALTASQLFSVDLKKVDPDQRRKAKAINFGLLYGKGAFALAEDLNISRTEASDIIKRYFERYPTIRGFLDGLKAEAKRTGYAETLFGRRRYIEGINSQNKMIAAGAERVAVNAPIQGTAADIVKIAMDHLAAALAEEKLKTRLTLQVHDELVLEAPADEIDEAKRLIKLHMESAGEGKIKVPLTVDIGVAKNWLDL